MDLWIDRRFPIDKTARRSGLLICLLDRIQKREEGI
jgi:hypothetical protein